MAGAVDLMATAALDLEGWTPIRVSWTGGEPVFDWCYTGEARFEDPFFDQTVERLLRRPFPLLFRRETSIGDVQRFSLERELSEPTGLIFHASRCGSTLVAQMLAALPGTHVLSEPPPVDTILRARFRRPDVSEDEQVAWVRATILALGRRDLCTIVKFDSWSAVDLALVRRAFPDVPWIFVYRDPAEILASQLRRRGAQMIPGVLPPQLFGLDLAAAAQLAPEEYCARVLEVIMRSGLTEYQGDPGRSLVANYRSLPGLVADRVAPLFGLELDDDARARMADVAGRDAKNPAIPYTGEGRADISPAALAAVRQWAWPVYERLEAAG